MNADRFLKRSACAAVPFAVVLTVLALASPDAIGACAPQATRSPSAPERPLYPMADDIYTMDRDATLFYYFQGNRDGTAKVKKELRFNRNLWNTCAQLQIRLPFITKYPVAAVTPYSPNADPYSGFGNAELRYLYAVTANTFDHSLVAAVALPTESNGVESIDTQLKFFYNVKWKWSGGALASTNEYDQTVIRPPGAGHTSYYEQELAVPYWSFLDSPALSGVKLSASYTGRVLFDDGSIYKSAAGFIMNGSINDFALSLRDTWGIGANGVWKYKVEANATARFNF